MLLPYGFILWIPAVASLLLYLALWNTGELLGRSPIIFAVWFLGGLVLQYIVPGVWFWLAGLLLQATLAFVLSIKWRMRA